MITQKPRILIRQDGRDLAFCHLHFRKALDTYVASQNSAGCKLTKTELRQNLAEHIGLSEESINNYAKGYNGPASIEIVQKMADYLEIDWTELMKEVSTMTDKVNQKMEEMENRQEINTAHQQEKVNDSSYLVTDFEKMTTWNAVREIYKALRVFVMFFEDDHSVELDLKDPSSDPIIRSYYYCWTILHKNMLDIPDSVYNDLEVLITELRYWIYGLPEEAHNVEIGEKEKDIFTLRYFDKLFYLELNEEFETEYSVWAERVTYWLVQDFYSAIRKIFKDYIPREIS